MRMCRKTWLPVALGLCAALGGCCAEAERPAGPVEAPRALVESYPPPVDPAWLPRAAPPQVPEPRIIEAGTRSTLIYACRHARAEVLKETIEDLISPEGTIEASPNLNRLVISDAAELVPGILDLLKELDAETPQVLCEARIIEITLDSDLEQELRYLFTNPHDSNGTFVQEAEVALETPGANPNPTLGWRLSLRPWSTEFRRLDAFIRFLLTKGEARLLSSPNLIVGVGEEASIITGQEVPVQSATVVSGSVSTTTVFKRVGIKLHVRPLQIYGDTALLDINPEVSAVTGYTAPGEAGVSNPIVAIRNVATTLSVKDGEILTIGGLLQEEDREVVRKVPGIGDVPGLGELFKSKRIQRTRTHLVFFLRISILGEGAPGTIRFHRPGAGLEGLDEAVEQGVAPIDPIRPVERDPRPAPPPPAPAPAARPVGVEVVPVEAIEPDGLIEAPPPMTDPADASAPGPAALPGAPAPPAAPSPAPAALPVPAGAEAPKVP